MTNTHARPKPRRAARTSTRRGRPRLLLASALVHLAIILASAELRRARAEASAPAATRCC